MTHRGTTSRKRAGLAQPTSGYAAGCKPLSTHEFLELCGSHKRGTQYTPKSKPRTRSRALSLTMLGQTEHKGPEKKHSTTERGPDRYDRPRRANLASRSDSPNKVTPEVRRTEQPQRYRRKATQEGIKKPERKGSRGQGKNKRKRGRKEVVGVEEAYGPRC